jgi:hypothetical protein
MALGIKYPDDNGIIALTEEADILASTIVAMSGSQAAKISGAALRGGASGGNIAVVSYYGTGAGQTVEFTPVFAPLAFVGARPDGAILFWSSLSPWPENGIVMHPYDYGVRANVVASWDEGSITMGSLASFCVSGYSYNLIIVGT